MSANLEADDDTREQPVAPALPSAPSPTDTHGDGRPTATGQPTGQPAWVSQQQPDRQWHGQQWQQPPGQQWQQPPRRAPQQTQWQQPPGQQWQQPPRRAPQQTWGPPPGYWTPVPQYPTNPLVAIGAIVLLVFGLLLTLVGALGLLGGLFAAAVIGDVLADDVAQAVDLSAFTTILLVGFGIVVLVGVLHLLSSIGIFLHRGWARALGIVLAVLGTLLGVIGVVAVGQDAVSGYEAGRSSVVPVLIAASYGVTLSALIAGGNHFTQRYGR